MGDKYKSDLSEDYWSLAGQQVESSTKDPSKSTCFRYFRYDDSRVDNTRNVSPDKGLGKHDGNVG